MMRNMAGMMKKVQEMQTRMEALQQEMADTEFTAAVGAGAVRVTITGKGEMRAVKIDPAAIDPEDIGMLEDMIRLATNNARAEADSIMATKMKDITGGLPLPPGMSLPF
jgi:DNA-binding YbaB/EbfC family protein